MKMIVISSIAYLGETWIFYNIVHVDTVHTEKKTLHKMYPQALEPTVLMLSLCLAFEAE